MARYKEPAEGEWVRPEENGYRIACCACGNVHEFDFRVVDGHIEFRAFAAPRSTGQVRRHMRDRSLVAAFKEANKEAAK